MPANARCAKPCRGASSFAWKGQGGAAGAGGMVSAHRVTCLSVPLIVQPQSERVVSAGTSAHKNSWPLCHHARGPHAGHTQTLAHASQCAAAERVSTGVCVHHARVSWISKQPGIICPSSQLCVGAAAVRCVPGPLCGALWLCAPWRRTRPGYIREGGKGGRWHVLNGSRDP